MSAICRSYRTVVLLLLCLALPLTGCGGGRSGVFSYLYLDVFDTTTRLTVSAGSQEEADAAAERIHSELLTCHRLFDIYHEYEGMTNLCTVNRLAGGEPVTVDGRIIDLLQFGLEQGEASGWKLNICAGSLLSVWHEARTRGNQDKENAALPDPEMLLAAQEHQSPDALQIDRDASTVCIRDPEMRLDVGAIAKGWAVERACRIAEENGFSGFLIAAGGNVRASGLKAGKKYWKLGVEDPKTPLAPLMTLEMTDCAAVTSGSYQRFYEVDGVRYCHIVDPDSGYPAREYDMVSVFCKDSGLADALSTALFLMPREEGEALAAASGAEALWYYPDGQIVKTPGFPEGY